MTTFTQTLYHTHPLHSAWRATITGLGKDYLELDRTLAYPEGGGQEPDWGVIARRDGVQVRFVDVRRVFSMPAPIQGVDARIGGIVRHMVGPENIDAMSALRIGDAVVGQIDVERRERLCISHTAAHLLYIAIETVRPGSWPKVFGCHIAPHYARFDLRCEERFTEHDLEQIEECANELVQADLPIERFAHEAHHEVRYWKCDKYVIPCGGTHLQSTGPVGPLRVRRKNIGKGKERIYCEFPAAQVELSKYSAQPI